MRKRVALFAWALVLVLSFSALAEDRADRYDLIFDASQDAGRLTARFLQLITRSGDESGDCTILTSPDGQVMVIDAGNPSTYPDEDRALQAVGMTRSVYLVASHPLADLFGSFAQLLSNFEIGAVYTAELEYPTSHYRNYMEVLERSNTPQIIFA